MPCDSNPPLPPTPLLPATQPLNILYADDVQQLRELLGLILKREGHRSETVENGVAAHAKLSRPGAAYDLLITDHHMPQMNGLELVRRTRALAFPGKIIVFSSETSPLVLDEYRQLNVDLILCKPVFPLTFRLMLRQLFPERYPMPVESAVPVS
jgi:two-component system chemotaxis response regulator CheY